MHWLISVILNVYRTPTNVLQQWNKPRQRQVDILPVEKLGDRHRELLPSQRSYGSGVVFDPRPISYGNSDSSVAVENLRCDLLQLDQQRGLLNIIYFFITFFPS